MKYTDTSKIDFLNIRVEDAMRLPLTSAEDAPVVIRCNGYEENWNSRDVATRFYGVAAFACEGASEGQRYAAIHYGCFMGEAIPSDGEPLRKPENTQPLTQDEVKRLAELRVSKHEAANRLNALRASNAPSDEIAKASTEWNDLAIEIIKLEKRERMSKKPLKEVA